MDVCMYVMYKSGPSEMFVETLTLKVVSSILIFWWFFPDFADNNVLFNLKTEIWDDWDKAGSEAVNFWSIVMIVMSLFIKNFRLWLD